jgi:hypothetical protein
MARDSFKAKPFGRWRGLDTVSSAMLVRNQADGERMARSNLGLKDVVFVKRSHAAPADVRFLLASAGGLSQTSATGSQLWMLPLQRMLPGKMNITI